MNGMLHCRQYDALVVLLQCLRYSELGYIEADPGSDASQVVQCLAVLLQYLNSSELGCIVADPGTTMHHRQCNAWRYCCST